MSRSENWQLKSIKSKKHEFLCIDIANELHWYSAVNCCWKTLHLGVPDRQVTMLFQQFAKFFSFIISLGLIIVWQILLEFVWKKWTISWRYLIAKFFGANDSLFTNINKFQSIGNILDSLLDLCCFWLFTSHMIHFRALKIVRVPWPTGKCVDLGCCGCLYCLLRSCVLAVSERRQVLP